MTKIQEARLKKLIDFLKKLDPTRFDLASWYYGRREELDLVANGENVSCGTTACVAGWCPTIFKRDWVWTRVEPSLKSSSGGIVQDFSDFFGIEPFTVSKIIFADGQGREALDETIARLEACLP